MQFKNINRQDKIIPFTESYRDSNINNIRVKFCGDLIINSLIMLSKLFFQAVNEKQVLALQALSSLNYVGFGAADMEEVMVAWNKANQLVSYGHSIPEGWYRSFVNLGQIIEEAALDDRESIASKALLHLRAAEYFRQARSLLLEDERHEMLERLKELDLAVIRNFSTYLNLLERKFCTLNSQSMSGYCIFPVQTTNNLVVETPHPFDVYHPHNNQQLLQQQQQPYAQEQQRQNAGDRNNLVLSEYQQQQQSPIQPGSIIVVYFGSKQTAEECWYSGGMTAHEHQLVVFLLQANNNSLLNPNMSHTFATIISETLNIHPSRLELYKQTSQWMPPSELLYVESSNSQPISRVFFKLN